MEENTNEKYSSTRQNIEIVKDIEIVKNSTRDYYARIKIFILLLQLLVSCIIAAGVWTNVSLNKNN